MENGRPAHGGEGGEDGEVEEGKESISMITEASVRRNGTTYDGQPRYDVLIGDAVVGHIEGHHPTFERGPRNARYVTARWKSKRRYWRAIDLSGRTVAWSCETIKRACWYFETRPQMFNQ
jgi:hypothetical protein